MLETHIYIQVDNKTPKVTDKRYGYVLEGKRYGRLETKEGFGKITGTYHHATLAAVVEALGRYERPSIIHIHSEDQHVVGSMARHLEKWANNSFLNSKGKSVANHEEWIKVWTLIQNHEIVSVPGKHSYTSWLLNEIEGKENR